MVRRRHRAEDPTSGTPTSRRAASKSLFMLRHLGAGRPVAERARLGVAFLGEGRKAAEAMLDNHWIAADELAARLGLAQRVRDSVEQTFERWDGKGVPKGAPERGDPAGRPPGRAGRRGRGVPPRRRRRRRGRGRQAAARHPVRPRARGPLHRARQPALCEGLDEASTWDAVLTAEPAHGRRLGDAEVESVLEAIADFTDVKSPYTIGHSRGVADLAGPAARDLRPERAGGPAGAAGRTGS